MGNDGKSVFSSLYSCPQDGFFIYFAKGVALLLRIRFEVDCCWICGSKKNTCGVWLKHNQKKWLRPNGGCFQNYRNELFNGRPILRFGTTRFVFIFVVLSSLAALFLLFPE